MSTEIDMDSQARIDTYLMNLRRCLGELPPEEVNDILREIRSHILERAQAAGELTNEKLVSILKALGKPEDIAPLYHVEAMVARARTSFSPAKMLLSTARWAMISFVGFISFIIGVTGYALGLGLLMSGIAKPFFPEHVGAFLNDGGLIIGIQASTAGSRELLGWWMIPVGIVFGTLFLIVTTHFLRWMLRYASARPAVGRTPAGVTA